MKTDEFENLCLTSNQTVRDALLRLDQTGKGILLVLDGTGALQRTLTDGDLRRAILGHLGEDASIATVAAVPPIHVFQDADAASVLALMDRHQIDQVPVLDKHGRPVDLIFRRELSQRIWLSSPHLGEEEQAFVAEAFSSNWIAPLGPHVDAFEKEVAAYAGVGYAAAVSSGTAALHLGLILLGVGAGDTVMCSSLTFVGSCNPILYCGARPVFIDSDPGSWNMSAAALERALEWAQQQGRLPKCVIVVNLYGQSADMDAIVPLCERYGVPILEDAAESLGAGYRGKKSGAFGRLAAYSFNGNKIITTSGGGMLLSDDRSLIEHARKLSTQAREPARHYEHREIGFNYRMSNVLAGIGRGQLKVLDQRVEQRRKVFDRYREGLLDFPELQWMPESEGSLSTRWLSCFCLTGPTGPAQCDQVMRFLERHQIEARPVWKPMHLQPLFEGAPYFAHFAESDVSTRLFESGICLPSGSNLTAEQQDRVMNHLRRALINAGVRHDRA